MAGMIPRAYEFIEHNGALPNQNKVITEDELEIAAILRDLSYTRDGSQIIKKFRHPSVTQVNLSFYIKMIFLVVNIITDLFRSSYT